MSAPAISARLAYANIFAADIEALSQFYGMLLGFPSMPDRASPIYRCLDAGGGLELGFNAPLAYELLGVAGRKPAHEGRVNVYLTFEAASEADVDGLAARAVALGGSVVKPPYDTYYNARQAVLEDPEGNVFRINHRKGARLPADQVDTPPWATGRDMA
jgi:predicted enzyme related to lactoylglutathione lyase